MNEEDLLVGRVVKVSTSRAEDLGSIPAFAVGVVLGRVRPVSSKLVIQWLPCQALGVLGSLPRLVGRVSVYCDRARQKV